MNKRQFLVYKWKVLLKFDKEIEGSAEKLLNILHFMTHQHTTQFTLIGLCSCAPLIFLSSLIARAKPDSSYCRTQINQTKERKQWDIHQARKINSHNIKKIKVCVSISSDEPYTFEKSLPPPYNVIGAWIKQCKCCHWDQRHLVLPTIAVATIVRATQHWQQAMMGRWITTLSSTPSTSVRPPSRHT